MGVSPQLSPWQLKGRLEIINFQRVVMGIMSDLLRGLIVEVPKALAVHFGLVCSGQSLPWH